MNILNIFSVILEQQLMKLALLLLFKSRLNNKVHVPYNFISCTIFPLL